MMSDYERTNKKNRQLALGPGVYIEAQEFELMWLLAYAAMNHKMTVPLHPEHYRMAKEMEVKLRKLMKELDPQWSHPLLTQQ